jgi:hypothetical protein
MWIGVLDRASEPADAGWVELQMKREVGDDTEDGGGEQGKFYKILCLP